MFLLLKILFDDSQRNTTSGAYKIGIGPQRRQFAPEHREFLAQEVGRTSFDELYHAVNAKLRIDTDQQMDMIWHNFQLLDLDLILLANLPNNLF
jgi:hypothetical protein